MRARLASPAPFAVTLVALALLLRPDPSRAVNLPRIPFPLKLQPNIGYFVPLSGEIDSLFEGSPKLGVAIVVPVSRRLEAEGEVEKVFITLEKPSPPGIDVTESLVAFTAGLRWGGFLPRAHALTYAVGGFGAYRKSVDIRGAGADTLGPEFQRTDFGFFLGGGFEIKTGDRSEVEVGIRVHAISGGPATTGWDTWFALTAGYSFALGRTE